MAPNRIIGRAFQKLKVKRSIPAIIQRAHQVTSIELLFDSCPSLTSLVSTVSPTILPLAEAGIILASIKEHGEDGVQKTLSFVRPRKRRHTERTRAPGVEEFPAVETEESAGERAIGRPQTGEPETEQLTTVQTGRSKKNEAFIIHRALTIISTTEIDYRCSEAPISLMPLLGNPLFDAVAASNQWIWERKVGGPTTDCMNAMAPEDRSQDISITLSVGYRKGLEVIDKFQLATT